MPIIPTPCSPLALCIAAFWALVIVAGVVARLPAVRGKTALPVTLM
jgi:hypothetical protein